MANVLKTFKISLPRDQRSQIIQLEIVEFAPEFGLEFAEKSFQFTGAFTWNEIPQQHRNYPSLNRYKKEMNSFGGAEMGSCNHARPLGRAAFYFVLMFVCSFSMLIGLHA